MKGIVFKHSSLVSGIEIRYSMGSRTINHFYRKPSYQLVEDFSLPLGKPDDEIGKFKLKRNSVYS